MRSDQYDSFVDTPTGLIRGGFLLSGIPLIGATHGFVVTKASQQSRPAVARRTIGNHGRPLNELCRVGDDICAVHRDGVSINTTRLEPSPWSMGKPVQTRRCPATVNGDETCDRPLARRLGRGRE
jgi:hypothetical protein